MSDYIYTGSALVGSPLTYTPTGRFPIVGGTVYETYQDMLDYISGSKSTAIGGSILFVIADEDKTKNGAYEVLFTSTTKKDGQIPYFVDGKSNLYVQKLRSEISDEPTEPVEDIHLTSVELTTEDDNKTYLVFTLSYTDEPIKVDVSELTNSAVVYEIESGTEESNYVHITIDTNEESLTKTLNVTTKTVALEEATTENDGLTTGVNVKNYIDNKISTAKEEIAGDINTAKSEAISEAKTYAETQANNALNAAKTYTDAEITTAKAEIDGDINTAKSEAITSANNYTNAVIAGLNITGGECKLTETFTTNIKVGFLESNTTLEQGTSITAILKSILVKKIGVKATNPSTRLVLGNGITTEREVGSALGTVNFTSAYTDGYYSSADTNYYSNTVFDTNNGTSGGKLNAGCSNGNAVLYCNDSAVEGNNYTNTTTQTQPTTIKFHTMTSYSASTVNTAKNSLGENETISIAAGNAKSNEVNINFYYTTKIQELTGVVWNEAAKYLDLNGTEYVPSTTLKDSMVLANQGQFLKTTTQYANNLISIGGNSSLAIFVPKGVTFNIYSDADTNKTTNLFTNFKKYSTTNTMGIEYDIYIFTNNSSAETKFIGLTYNSIS